MSKINLNGKVLYADLTPAVNATVVIKDLDLIDQKHDKILTRTTNIEGKFSGLSSEWNDTEGKVFGLPSPDILLLQFTVTVPGFNPHTGPFTKIGSDYAPIILPFLPAKPVARANRELVQVITLRQGFTGTDAQLYNFIEQFSRQVTNSVLSDDYHAIHVLFNTGATLANFTAKLTELGQKASVKAIDIMINTHGSTNNVWFYETPEPNGVHKNDVKAALLAMPAAVRSKLRAVFSTACMGDSCAQAWLDGGFKVSMGSVGIYADSETSFYPLVDVWSKEKTFRMAIDAANNILNMASDEAARVFYRNSPDAATQDLASKVNSFRNAKGNTDIRIYSKP